MPFGIPSEDFHGGFGLPHDEDNEPIVTVAPTTDSELDEILTEISGIFDYAYESSDDKEEKQYICDVEDRLIKYLTKRGLI